jgi:HTH-type transcriptional regulator, sugar sensing transcriptional regulator
VGETLIHEILKNFSLTEKESDVYIFLAKKGILKSSEIAKGSNNHKAETYRILKNLQSKGVIELTLESPTRYSAIPFETLLDNFIKSERMP